MNWIMAVSIGFCVLLSSGTAMAAGAGQEGGMASVQAPAQQQE